MNRAWECLAPSCGEISPLRSASAKGSQLYRCPRCESVKGRIIDLPRGALRDRLQYRKPSWPRLGKGY